MILSHAEIFTYSKQFELCQAAQLAQADMVQNCLLSIPFAAALYPKRPSSYHTLIISHLISQPLKKSMEKGVLRSLEVKVFDQVM